MIDEKKITEAVNAYIGYAKEIDEGVETSMRRDAFRDGVEWFKKAIWHDAKEEPKEHKCILVQWINKGRICYETYTKENNDYWQYVVMTYNVTKWCYINNILPKGGEK